MDHEIENDVNVECSRSKNTKPVHLEKKWLMKNGANRSNRRIESFEMADLNDAVMALRQSDQVVGLLEGCGERFFYQDIDTSRQEFRCHGSVLRGGNSNRRCVGMLFRTEQFRRRFVYRDTKLGGEIDRSSGIRLDDPNETDWSSCSFKRTPDAQVIPTKYSRRRPPRLENEGRSDKRRGYFLRLREGSGYKVPASVRPDPRPWNCRRQQNRL